MAKVNLIKYLEKTNYGSELGRELGQNFIELIGLSDEQIRLRNLPQTYLSLNSFGGENSTLADPIYVKLKEVRRYNWEMSDPGKIQNRIDKKIKELGFKVVERKMTEPEYIWLLDTLTPEIVAELDRKIIQELREELRTEATKKREKKTGATKRD